MSIVACPRCGDKVSVPPAASPSALVQCPLCCEEYYLSDALIQLPPMLVVVGGHAAPAGKDVDYQLAEPATAAVSSAIFETTGGSAASVAPRPQLRTVSRRRPQEKSAVGEIIKVVLGGVAGLAGGLLVLWWGFGVDVGELAPKVSKVQYLRFLVPPKWWDHSVENGKASPQLDTLDAKTATSNQASNKNKKTNGSRAADGDGSSGRELLASEVESAFADPSKSKSGASGKGTKAKAKADEEPLLTLDPLGLDDKSPAKSSEDLKIEDPLSDLKPAVKEPAKDETPDEKPAKRSQEPKSTPAAPNDESSTPKKPEPAKPDGKSPSEPADKEEKPEPAKPSEPSGEPPSPSEKSPPAESPANGQEPQPE